MLLQLLDVTALSQATIAVDRYYTNDDDVTVIKMVRMKVQIMLTAVMKSGGRAHGDDGPLLGAQLWQNHDVFERVMNDNEGADE